jgi:hypothetical protein
MKKLLTAIMAAAIIATFTACDSSQASATILEDETRAAATTKATETTTEATEATTEATTTEATTTEATTAAAASITGSAAMDKLVAKMQDGEFGFDFEMTLIDDENGDKAIGSVAVQGEKTDMIMTLESAGTKTTMHILVSDGKTYIIDDTSKSVLTMGEEIGVDMAPFGESTFSDITLIEAGEVEIKGVTLSYEDYEQDGETVRFYVKDGEIDAYETMDGENVVLIIFTSFEDDVPDDRFVIPADYTEMG